MGRVLAIDYGTKRVGIAVTDPLRIIASPLETVPAHQLMDYLKKYDEKEGIDEFVVGMPKNLQNKNTDATKHVFQLLQLLKKHFPEKKVHQIDERFTSVMAQQAMIVGGMKKSDRREKGAVDKISAAIILQSYLERF
jgi:putative holliday junction resolvase